MIDNDNIEKTKNGIPSGFKFASSVKESHPHSIYCVAWSTDMYSNSSTDKKSSPSLSDNVNNNNNDCQSTSSSISSEKAVTTTKKTKDEFYRCFATCAGPFIHIYEVGCTSTGTGNNINLRQAYKDFDADEVFYCCAFGGRGISIKNSLLRSKMNERHISAEEKDESFDTRNYLIDSANPSCWKTIEDISKSNPEEYLYVGNQLLCCAGVSGILKVIDPGRRCLVMTLSGHGDDIYDIKFSPMNECLLLTASKDESIRLWNLKSCACVAIFSGHEGHRGSVLSISFHPLSTAFVSSGMDVAIKIWSLDDKAAKQAISDSYNTDDDSVITFKTKLFQLPIFSTNQAFTDYVDCVQFLGNLILSKSTTNKILLWKPDFSNSRGDISQLMGSYYPNPTDITDNGKRNKILDPKKPNVIPLREFNLTKCDLWFIRFHVDESSNRMIAIGNTEGDISVWDIDQYCSVEDKSKKRKLTEDQTSVTQTTNKDDESSQLPNTHKNENKIKDDKSNQNKKEQGYILKKAMYKLQHKDCNKTIRMVTFSPDSNCLIACGENGGLWKWDATFFKK